MRLGDIAEETVFSVTSNKARSALTVLGIVVGIASVIVMVSLGQGTKTSITSSIESAGSNLVMVMPGFGGGGGGFVRGMRGAGSSLTMEDAEAIAELSGVREVSKEASTRQQVIGSGSNNSNTQIQGATPAYSTVRNVTVAEGQFITQADVDSAARVAVLGPTTRDDLFGENASNVIGQSVRINGVRFKVVGVTASKGGSGFSNQDDVIYAPLSTVQQRLIGAKTLSTIGVSATSADQVDIVKDEVTTLLLQRHNVADSSSADFSVMSQSDIAATASTVTNTLTILLGGIAGISLVVGGIGIMNMMLTAVTERTREIGLRKAVGARRSDITAQFLAESVALTFLGGVIGVALGIGVAFVTKQFFGITTTVTLWSVLLAAGVSVAIGVVFGYYPAFRASAMNPVEALRYQ
jgi:putative ABC transport system permease protein